MLTVNLSEGKLAAGRLVGWLAIAALAAGPSEAWPFTRAFGNERTAKSQGDTPQPDSGRIVEMLEARASSNCGLYLPFAVDRASDHEASPVVFAHGWWAASGLQSAAAVVESFDGGATARFEWATWDGARSSVGIAAVDWASHWPPRGRDHPILLPTESVHVSRRPFPGPLSRSWLPSELGWGFANQPWGRYLRSMVDVRTIGRETLRGVDCARLAFDMGASPGKQVFPWVLWVDDRSSFLVLRTVSYQTELNLVGEEFVYLDGVAPLFLGDQEWLPIRSVDVLEWKDLDCGLRIGCLGQVRNALKSHAALDATIRVDVSQATCSAPLDPRLFELKSTPGASLRDESTPGGAHQSGAGD